MTDSEINELLATRVMGWTSYHRNQLDHGWLDNRGVFAAYAFRPCNDYNDLRQVEEALNVDQKMRYARTLVVELDCDMGLVPAVISVLDATARQRCDVIAKVVE